MERLYTIARQSVERSPDGVSQLELFGNGFARIFHGDNNDAYYAQVEAPTRQWAAKQAKRGLEMYTRVYLTAACEYKGALSTQTRAEWPKMEQGFRDMLTRFPDPITINRFAWVACLAQDKPTTAELLDQIGDQAITSTGARDGTRAFESCKRWARSV